MKLICLGTGGAFTLGLHNYQSNFLLISPSGKKMLIDCGTDIRFSLNEQGVHYADIDAVYISHFHADHVGGLEWLGFKRKFSPHPEKPRLFIKPEMKNQLWEHVLSGGMACIQGVGADLDTFFVVETFKSEDCFEWEGVEFQLIRTFHSINNDTFNPSYGLKFFVNGKMVWITTDLQLTPDFHKELYKDAALIFHDCEISSSPSQVHPDYEELKKFPAEIKQKMWLYHYDCVNLPDVCKEGFPGLAKKGQVFNLDQL